jgi:hypothetical protein
MCTLIHKFGAGSPWVTGDLDISQRYLNTALIHLHNFYASA